MAFYSKGKTIDTENKSLPGVEVAAEGHEGRLGWRDCSVVIQLCTFVKTHQTVHLPGVRFRACKLFFGFKNGFLCMTVIRSHASLFSVCCLNR